ncbi:MAG TPA: DMT family transporter [Actinomycetota bacterium]|nr:DMT family transporter [Actinomycetota bacterium]
MKTRAEAPPASASPRRPSPFPRTPASGLALAFATALISGVAIFANGYGVTAFGSGGGVYTTAKNLVAAVLLLLVGVAATRARSDEGFTRPRTGPQWAGLIAVSVIGGSVPFLLFFEGLARASSVQAAFLHKTLLIWVVLLAWPLLGERIGALQVVAIGLLLAGQAALQGGVGEVGLGTGEVMILAATLLWSIEVIVAKRLLGSLSSLTVGTARMALGCVVLLSYLAVTGQFDDLLAVSATQWAWATLTGGLLATYVASWYLALARARAIDVTAVLVFGAVVTALLAMGVQGAEPQAAALALLVLGTVIAVVAARRGTVSEVVRAG